MNKDDDEIFKKEWFMTFTPSGADDFLYKKIIECAKKEPAWFGVDWAVNSGYNRGDVISRNGNVTEVRFKTVDIFGDQS